MSNLFDACLCVNEFSNLFCNPSITDSNDQSLIGQSGHSTFLVNHSLALPLSCIPKNCTWVSVYLTPKRPCSLNHCSIPATNVLYTLRSEHPVDVVRGTWLQPMCCTLPKICVPNLTKGQGQRLGGGGWSLVGGAMLEMGKRVLSQRGSEGEDRWGLNEYLN